MSTGFDDMLRLSSRVILARGGRVFLRPAGSEVFVDIGYCRIESDESAAITVKHALSGRRVIGYSDRLELTWLQTSVSEMGALSVLLGSEIDLKLSRVREADEGGGSEERLYLAYFMQLLPSLGKGEIKMILEKQMSVAQFQSRMVLV